MLCRLSVVGGGLLRRDFASASTVRYVYRKPATALPPTNETSTTPKDRPKGPLRNERIAKLHKSVRLVDSKTGQLGPPTPTHELIAMVKAIEEDHFLELVSENPEPLVKCIPMREEYARMKEAKQKQRASRVEMKEVQMTWNVDSADLQHKLKKVRDGLEKGQRIDVVIAPKARQPVPRPEEMEARMQEIVDLIGDIGEEREARKLERRIAIICMQRTKAKS